VCLCIASTITATEGAWRETAPATQERGVEVVCSASRPATLDLQDGDVLTSVGGHEVCAWPDAIAAILEHASGEPVQFHVQRGGAPVQLTATRR
jgi:S1-C subfamily serine protease